jgi:hypothetical protein
LSRALATTLDVEHPPLRDAEGQERTADRYQTISYIGLGNGFFWAFDRPADESPGDWLIRVSIDRGENPPLVLEQRFGLLERPRG